MEALLQSLATKYGFDYAAKLLGLDKQTQNPKYAISVGGNTLDIGNIFKRAGFNQSMKGIMGGGKLGGMLGPGLLLGGALGLGYLTNPLREGSYNYNPELQGQIDYASGKGYIDRNNSMNALRYNKNSILSGQNVVSGFGTNDYGKQLQKYKDKYKDTMPKERLEQLDREIQDQITDDFDKVDKFIAQKTPAAPVYTQRDEGDRGGGGGTNNTQHGSSGMTKSQHSAFRMARGGIASL